MEESNSEDYVRRQIEGADKPIISFLSPFPQNIEDEFTVTWFYRSLRVMDGLDSADRFIFLWIAFNSILRKKYGEQLSDYQLIKECYTSEEWKVIFKNSRYLFKNHVSKLRELSPVINMKNTNQSVSITNGEIEDVIKTIYQIRCNLFHGRKNADDIDSRDYNLIRSALAILLSITIFELQKGNLLSIHQEFIIDSLLDGYDIMAY